MSEFELYGHSVRIEEPVWPSDLVLFGAVCPLLRGFGGPNVVAYMCSVRSHGPCTMMALSRH